MVLLGWESNYGEVSKAWSLSVVVGNPKFPSSVRIVTKKDLNSQIAETSTAKVRAFAIDLSAILYHR